jgi:hypothetical protein
MANWKTTLFGILAIVPPLIDAIVPILPPKWAPVMAAISGAIALWFAKDKDVK